MKIFLVCLTMAFIAVFASCAIAIVNAQSNLETPDGVVERVMQNGIVIDILIEPSPKYLANLRASNEQSKSVTRRFEFLQVEIITP